MDDLLEFCVIVILPGALFIGAILAIALWADSASCRSQWRESGFRTSWGPVQGCLISRDGVTWIPAENYREIR